MDPLHTEEQTSMFNPIGYVLQFLARYGWWLAGGAALALCALQRLRPALRRWRQAREDAEYHKDPDKALAREAAVQRARRDQQRLLLEASERALRQQREREERRRAEAAERLRKYAGGDGGQRLGAGGDEFLPLSGGASASSYRAPKRSACGGGGCGR